MCARRCPTLSELPLPSAGKTGWPWTQESSQLPDTMPDGSPWPRVSIVTPSYNQGQFIEETIRSVLLQGYPNIEYIIIDGGSTDNSLEIIRKYEQWISYWVSEPDSGQSHAINKGFNKATGEIFGWLNSDDYYHPGGLATLVQLRQKQPDCVAWVGANQEIDITGKPLRSLTPRVGNKAQIGDWGTQVEAHFHQPSCLFSAKQFAAIGGVNERLEYALDVELWMRLAETGNFATTGEIISYPRIYPEAKTFRDRPMQETELISINFNLGQPEVARRRLVRFQEKAVDMMTYCDLLIYLVKRTVSSVLRRLHYK
ncbi:glycosyltransferase family 2 protein [Microcoleus sp. FACHB-672]|uniref:glycosyltransferase family 2 protein n=1 Tax=Microcoleus sp. FACHB-672 TaxID=2692825 RepID=UPI001682C330|nr:glycosyltransferase family 2 protein [Microcoleus sp. FACHB-672]MBD2039813.1 glycosyltransferase [Microcoleus sp. FACHB-672]